MTQPRHRCQGRWGEAIERFVYTRHESSPTPGLADVEVLSRVMLMAWRRIKDPTLQALLVGGACLLLAGLILVVVHAGAVLTWHPEFQPHADRQASREIDPLTLSGRDFQPIGLVPIEQRGDVQTITQYVDNRALWVAQEFFEAEDFPLLQFNIDGIHRDMMVTLAWRRLDMPPGSVHEAFLHTSGDGAHWHNMTQYPQWRGTIAEVRIGGVGRSADERFVLMRNEPLTLRSLTFQPYSWAGVVQTIWDEWTAFEGWTNSSINRFRGHPHRALLPPNRVVGVMFWLAAGLVLVCWLWSVRPSTERARASGQERRRLSLTAALGVVLMGCWLVQDGVRMGFRVKQAADTQVLFAGRPYQDKVSRSRLRCDMMKDRLNLDCRVDEPLPHL